MAKKRAEAESVPEPENPFADFTLEAEPLTAEQRAVEQERLEDFFARKRADPSATWDAAPTTVEQRVEANFFAFMDELRGVTPT